MLFHQTSACYVELFIARDLVTPPVVSSLAAAVDTATAIYNEPSDLMDPVAGAKVCCCDYSLHISLFCTLSSIRVIFVHCTDFEGARQLSVEHLEHGLGLDVHLVVRHENSQNIEQRHDNRSLAPNECQEVLHVIRRFLRLLSLDQLHFIETKWGVFLLCGTIGCAEKLVIVDHFICLLRA